ncbi:MAG: beta-N-acetylhexosaminidase [Cryomorphaceae bacterium]|nr:beta-N-acetylhexosaminidase [Cryomorphaceae bacterium]
MRIIILLGIVLPCLNLYAQALCPILPKPVTYIDGGANKSSLLRDTLHFNAHNLPQSIAEILPEIASLYLPNASLVELTPNKGFITFQQLTGGYPESYSINVNTDQIRITYTSESSCFNALQSLFQLITMEDDSNRFKIPVSFVKDYPSFRWRGLHLDVSRHFFSVAEVKQYLDLMSMYKFNVFHWHLTDDQGWRMEIKRYPKLTSIGAWRDSTIENHYSTFPRTWNTTRYGGFYTQEQIKEVVAYAAARQITVVPEIEMPGHARAALAAYPEYSCNGNKQAVPGVWGVFDDVFCTKDSTILFLQNILDEVMELFPSPYIHVGGDEVPKTRWKQCPRCQATIKTLALADEHELQSYFIGQMDQYLQAQNRKLIGWDEILEGGLTSGAAVMSWRGTEGGIAAAKQGHFVVMSPGSHCYFDHYQGKSVSEPLAIGGYTPLEKVYEFNPIPEGLKDQEAQYILGGQANLWTEYIPSFEQLTYMTYPRAIALSQTLWGGTKAPYKAFEGVLKTFHIPRLMGSILDTYVSLSFMKPSFKFNRTPDGISLGFEFKDTNESVVVSANDGHDGVWLDHNKTIAFERTTKNTAAHNLTFFSPCCADSLRIISHQGLGAQVTYITPPNSRYDSGDLTLVDGQFGARPWRGYQWVGFDTNSVTIRIDLGKKTKIRGLELGFLQEPSSWIHLPEEVAILTDRNQRKTFKITAERTSITYRKKTQSLLLTVKGLESIPPGLPGEGNTPWIFADEFIVK